MQGGAPHPFPAKEVEIPQLVHRHRLDGGLMGPLVAGRGHREYQLHAGGLLQEGNQPQHYRTPPICASRSLQ